MSRGLSLGHGFRRVFANCKCLLRGGYRGRGREGPRQRTERRRTMRRLLVLPLVAAVLLVVAPTAQSATKTVSITAAGFVPATASIQTGDTVTWTNSDTKNHQVISQDAGFASPILKPNESFSFTFKDAGRFQYSDALVKTLHGLVSVTTPPPTGAPTLVASRSSVVFGGAVRLSGKVPNEQAGEHVMLKATVLTASGLHTAT